MLVAKFAFSVSKNIGESAQVSAGTNGAKMNPSASLHNRGCGIVMFTHSMICAAIIRIKPEAGAQGEGFTAFSYRHTSCSNTPLGISSRFVIVRALVHPLFS